jgi:hypothetical protein
MRKLLLVSGLLMGGALLSGSPASAATGCSCVKLGQNPVCVASIEKCVSGMGGLCVAPCEYKPPKMMKDKMKKNKM